MANCFLNDTPEFIPQPYYSPAGMNSGNFAAKSSGRHQYFLLSKQAIYIP